ncbi:hypothetical protein M407DRAFT_7136 [Tulasnella calospora MUT 4182]|uniref:Uncharacterized protein n=1 Tax=Tulasnella calospora MUT 4182 TaxID=1051891 RepID=A0A0C3L275_9AGAM|nr:hypothetical protein M407DRAFT_7136 [Tulasnella calospora MUT 4182]
MWATADLHPVQTAVWISSFARDICQQLNKTVTEQEQTYIKPPDHDGPGRYEARFRRNGRTFTILDTYAERGIEVPANNSKPVGEIVTQIANRQCLDFIRGNLNNHGVYGRMLSKICQILEDPVNMLTIPNQTTKPFRVYPSRHPEYAIIADHREMAEREGDDSPYYWMWLEWLLHDFNIAHFEWYKLETAVQDYNRSQYEQIPVPRKHGKIMPKLLNYKERKAQNEIYVSGNESSSSESSSIKSPTGYTSDEPMNDESNEVRVAGDDSLDEEGYYLRPRDIPILASLVLAALMVRELSFITASKLNSPTKV